MIKHLKAAPIDKPAIPRATLRLAAAALSALSLVASAAPAIAADTRDYHARVVQVLKRTPLIDGHNDLPWEIRERFKGRLAAHRSGSRHVEDPAAAGRRPPLMTDIPRLRAGLVGGQFWSVWVPVDIKGPKRCRSPSSKSIW